MYHKIIWGLEVEETDGTEDPIMCCAGDFPSQAAVA